MYYRRNYRIKRIRPIWLVLIVGFLLLGGVFLHSQKQAIRTAGTDSRPFALGVKGPIQDLHPALVDKPAEKLVSSSIYEGLLYYDEKQKKLRPLLASSWKYSDEGKTLSIKLRKDVKFHSGKNLTAADVKSSWEQNLGMAKEWSDISLFIPIVGTKEKLQGARTDISGIEVVNDYSLRIRFIKPHAAFLYIMTNPMFSVAEEAEKNALGTGTGPYMLKEQTEKFITLLPNEDYYRGKPLLSAIQVMVYPDESQALKDFREGKLDYLNDIAVQEIKNLSQDTALKACLIRRPVLETYWLGFNMNRDPFANNYLLRRALNYAIDREAIIKKVFGEGYKPSKGVVPEGLDSYNRKIYGYRYDLAKARRLLAEAGYPEGEGLKPLTLTVNSNVGHEELAAEIARQMEAIGIQVQVQSTDWDYFKKQMNRLDMSFFRLGWKADYPDADNYLYSLFHSSGVGLSNFTAYRNPQVDKILDESRAEYKDEEERIKCLKRAEEIIVDDAPCLFLFQKEAIKLAGKQVKGLSLSSTEGLDWFSIYLSRPEIPVPTPEPEEKEGKPVAESKK